MHKVGTLSRLRDAIVPSRKIAFVGKIPRDEVELEKLFRLDDDIVRCCHAIE